MCRWIAYAGQPVFLDTLVCRPVHSLLHQSQAANECHAGLNGDGFGLGWYGLRDEPGVYRDVLPAWGDENLKSLCRQIASPLFFAHVRASTGTPVSRENCHPFVRGPWMFMHNGQVGGWAKIRRAVEQQLTDRAFAARRGNTDSEALFLMLDDATLAHDPVEALRDAVVRMEATMARAGIDEPLRIAAAITDGRTLHVIRYASDDRPPSLYWRETEGDVIIASEPLDDDRDHWNAVSPSSAISLRVGGALSFRSFDVRRHGSAAA